LLAFLLHFSRERANIAVQLALLTSLLGIVLGEVFGIVLENEKGIGIIIGRVISTWKSFI
jgi:hypothetical protein